MIASARSEPPQGYARWTLQMLEGRVVEFNIVETCTPIPAKPGATETRRLRVSAQRHRQPVHDIRTPGRLAAGRSVRPLCGGRLCAVRKELSDTHILLASKIVLVQDNLSTDSPPRSTKSSRPRKPAASSSGSRGTTHRSTGVGRTRLNANSVCCRPSVLIVASPTRRA